ncbi:MAG: hypothetical protein GWN12_06865, partial [Thermoplasmata archaeon]|nr:hypothetical protein [Thermoplasmata archaeon]NIW88499.1 hypothetical protein [Thermoplasmata archaeon]
MVTIRGWHRASSVLCLAAVIAVFSGSSIASASEFYLTPSPIPVFLVALPIIGMALLLISALP